ncbi:MULTISPECIES: sugar ABC transporter ATP-binding protein [unclassified Aureimonas]|uniref:sugar ABC transporter ATP-binding protein n=1 Tax=unclassified Aureimonas TaxID=2615206 RepID=UPI0006F958D4|nr:MULTISPECIES: sugar ABC transporter ATP-binding protein [unclassified Aureimonas]KQT52451.1 sugar ABC transporter ATP-binding protein [Aureimonas sp. Leaf427]KQT77648.1 sugar ABC transporter ATP-binding protein [Aureimonas sp. Leaf460]
MARILDMRGIAKRFGTVQALGGVDFQLEAGEIHALLGINGAGKSTLIKILSGVYTKDEGTIEIAGAEVQLGTPRAAIEAGIATVQQHPELVPDCTGVENIFLGHEGRKPGLFARIDRGAMRDAADRLLQRFPIEIDLDQRVGEMPAVDREIVAILHALRHDDIKVLILDEPTSTLTEREKASLFQLMRALQAAGIAIIYITHRLEEVFEIADRFTVFRGGRNVATFTSREALETNVSIPELMLDEAAGELFPVRDGKPEGEVLLEASGLGRSGHFSGVDFQLRRGEILGVFGLVGSGVDELSKVLFGAMRPDEGTIRVKGRDVRFSGPHDALKAGIFLVPGDRRAEGLTMTKDVVFNTTVAHLGKASGLSGLLRFSRNRRDAEALARDVGLQPLQLDRPVSAFSGGNQQKIVIAKGLFRTSDIYIFVEPTVGVDIGARAKLYALMRELSRRAGVIVMSSDCDEVHGLADRVMALYKGRPVRPDATDTTRDQLLAAGIMGARAA